MTYIGDKVTRSNLRSNYNKSIKILLTTYEVSYFISFILINRFVLMMKHFLKHSIGIMLLLMKGIVLKTLILNCIQC